jgi:hypothetical protein
MFRKIKRKIKIKLYNEFSEKLSSEDLRGYRNILKLLYHPQAETPLKDPDINKFFIQVPHLHLDLIIDNEKAEIVNTRQVYPLNLNKKVTERAVQRIREEVSKQRTDLENIIRGRKQNILHNLYSQIK